jgi:hypothetical protein
MLFIMPVFGSGFAGRGGRTLVASCKPANASASQPDTTPDPLTGRRSGVTAWDSGMWPNLTYANRRQWFERLQPSCPGLHRATEFEKPVFVKLPSLPVPRAHHRA